jgi:rhamnose transport system substrate-binding protein
LNKTLALTLALAAVVAAGALAASSSGAAHRRYTIAFFVGANDPRLPGARLAAKRLGVRAVVSSDYDVQQLVARHVDAIVGDGYDPTLRPFFRQASKAGIRVLSSGDDIAAKRDLWVSYSGTVAFAHALADALHGQMLGGGEYAILEEQQQYPIATTWEKDVAAYIAKAYPSWTLDAVLKLSGAGDQTEVNTVKSFMSAHPNLHGLIAITPTEAYMAAEAITQAGRIGQVFSAGNGGSGLDPQLEGYISSGAMEDVVGGDPVKLGYLTVWAANHLLTGHHFRHGTYKVGGRPVGRVHYYRHNKELRLGKPLTITKNSLHLLG